MEHLFPFERIKREILTKTEAETNPNFGKNAQDLPISDLLDYGIVNINKPQGPSSHQVTDYVKKILELNKAGHSGTLDPNVTGSLIIAFGKATRVINNLLKAGKEYVCLMHLHSEVEEKKLRLVMNSFVKKIEQLPPVRSAVKRNKRQREIYWIEILEIKNNQDILFRVGCEAGTYVRKLCHDIGLELNTNAHMVQLIRTRVGPFNEDSMYSLYELKDAYELYKQGNEKELRKIILSIETAVHHLPKIWVSDYTVNAICHGADLAIPGIVKLHSNIQEKELVAIMTLKNELVATGTSLLSTQKILVNNKGIAIKIEKVFMQRNIYPKYIKNSN